MTTACNELELLRAGEVAAILGLKQVTAELWMRTGRLPVVRLGRRAVRVRRSDIARIIEERTVAAVA
jgi:excisionase family DNA binding protein